MKLTNTHSMKAKSGMTLLELTVVILVLLSLISILFVGARAWKKGSDRSANIMNVRNAQQALRGHQNTRGFIATDTIVQTDIIGATGYIKKQRVPVTATGIPLEYTYGTTYGEPGIIYVTNAELGQTEGAGDYFYTTDEVAEKASDW
jgi:prepilin-type N-terminal cleavage/methylation domain-containing protein